MKYVALLRGINVGGKNLLKMQSLREAFEKNGFVNTNYNTTQKILTLMK